MFSPEFARAVVIGFNWAFGTMVLLAVFQLVLDAGTLAAMLVRKGGVPVPDGMRYAIAGILAAIGVHQAIRVPPVRDVEIRIAGLDPAFDGYTLLRLTDLHISRLFPQRWARAVVERANALDPA